MNASHPLIGLFYLALVLRAKALIMTGGAEPLSDRGWPAGTAKAAALPSRFFWAEGPPFGGGEWTFFHRGDTAALQAATDVFAGIESVNRQIHLHPGHPTIPYAARQSGEEPARYDWSFTVWQTDHWTRLAGPDAPAFLSRGADFGSKTPPLRLDVWLHSDGPRWDDIKLPTGVTVTDGRAGAHGFREDRLTIRVDLSEPSGRKIDGARIELVPASDISSKPSNPVHSAVATGGSATLADVEPGRYRVVARAPGYAARVVGTTTADGDTFLEMSATLEVESTATGIVVDTSGKPIPGVVLQPFSLVGHDGRGYQTVEERTATTDASGRFELRGLPSARIQISARRPGLHQEWDPRESIELPARDLSIRMTPTGTVRVHVGTNGSAHIQEAGRSGVGSWGGFANADLDGWVEFDEVPVGEYVLSRQPNGSPSPDLLKVSVLPGLKSEVRIAK